MAGYNTETITIYKYGGNWYTWDALVAKGHSQDYTESQVATDYILTVRATDFARPAVVYGSLDSTTAWRLTGDTDFHHVRVGNTAYAVHGLHAIMTEEDHPGNFFNYASIKTAWVTLTATTSDAGWGTVAAVWGVYDSEVEFGERINATNQTGGAGSEIRSGVGFKTKTIVWNGEQHTKRRGYEYYIGFLAGFCDVTILTGVRNIVSFEPNGGAIRVNSHYIYTSGGHLLPAQRLPANTIWRTGYVFTAWNTMPDGSGVMVPDQGVPGDYGLLTNEWDHVVTLHAQWQRQGFSVTVSNQLGVGTLSLENPQGDTIATESGGTLSYSTDTIAAGAYRIACTLSDGTKIAAKMEGALAGTFTPAEGDELSFVYEPSLCAVSASMQYGAVTFSREADAVVGGVDKWLAGELLTATITPVPGRKISAWSIMDAGGMTIATGTVTPAQTAPYDLSLNLTEDISIGATFEAAQYTVSALVDEASSNAVASAWVDVKNAGGGNPTITVGYGTIVVFRAIVNSGFGFAGWFAPGATEGASTAVPGTGTHAGQTIYEYEMEVTADVSMVAKATAPVSAVCVDENGDPVLGASVSWTGTEDGFAVLGSTIGYTLNTGGYHLDGWFDAADMTHPLVMGLAGELPMDGAIDLVAKLSATEPTKTLTVEAYNADGTALLTVDDFVTFADVTSSSQSSPVSEQSGSAGTATHTVNGVRIIRATALGKVTPDSTELYFLGWFADGALIASTLSVDLLVSSNRTVQIRYGSARTVRVTAGIVRAEAELTPGRVTVNGAEYADIAQEAAVTLNAVALNGWKFEGWFDDPAPITYADPLSESEQWTTPPIYAETTFYAYFSRETDFICEWEGAGKNKTMTWRSKVYVASKPFNPTSARVDADGYPVQLSVGAWSSPDVAATSNRTARILTHDQDARRLQMMRAERYLRIDVEADVPVDAVFVGTSMEGLAV